MPAPQTTLAPLQLVTPVLSAGMSTLSIDSTVLPITVLADGETSQIEISLYNQTAVVTGQYEFSTNQQINSAMPETSVQILGRNYNPNATWQVGSPYPVGYRYVDANGNVQVVVKKSTDSSVSGQLSPAWGDKLPTSITNVGISSGTLTVSCTNTFSPGQRVYLNDLTNATFLNDQTVVVLTATPTQFTAALNHADYAAQSDTGTVREVTLDGGLTWANFGFMAVTPTIKFTLLYHQTSLSESIAPPSGIIAKKGQNSCVLEWATPDYPGFLGVRVMLSTDYAGINPPYTQFGDLVTSVSRTSQVVINEDSVTQIDVPTALVTSAEIRNNVLTVMSANHFRVGTVVVLSGLSNAAFLNGETITITSATPSQFQAVFTANDYAETPDSGTATSVISTSTITNVQTVMATNFSSVEIPAAYINAPKFYAMFSTVIQDPNTNTVYESVQSGPLTGGFVNLKLVSPTDFPVLQRKEDIAGRIIGQVTRNRPELDLSTRSEIRDLFIDPFSIEASNMAVREWFARVSQSISAITQIDDSTGTGLSDPFQSSPYKQQIARAYGLSAQDTQNLIDEQFNILGEQAGLIRGTATSSTVVLTFYTYQQPRAAIMVPKGAVVATISDSNTPSLTFTTTGQGVIDTTNLSSFYNPQYGWWSVSVPAQCDTTGTVTNVGAGSIRQMVGGVPSMLNVTNLTAAQYGKDRESNSQFAARIQARVFTGVDTGTRHGYLVTALSTPGVVDAQVVAAGDLEMLRDWDAVRQKHVFGTVDIYSRGTTTSQQDESTYYQYKSTGTYGVPSTYLSLTYSGTGLSFQIDNFSSLPYPLYSVVEVMVSRGDTSFYLGTARAQFDTDKDGNQVGLITLHPDDETYHYAGSSLSKVKVPWLVAGGSRNQDVVHYLGSVTQGTYSFKMFARYKSPLTMTPELQPVLGVLSAAGQADKTGSVPNTAIDLIHTSDFLLEGGSDRAADEVRVSVDSQLTQKTITAQVGVVVPIDTAMDVAFGVASVRSEDFSTLYQSGVDYRIVPISPYHQYGLLALTGGSIESNQQIVVAYNKFVLYEHPTFVKDEVHVLYGTLPTTLSNSGFVNNTWLPESYGNNSLILDGWNTLYGTDGGTDIVSSTGLVGAKVPYDSRYIKVVYNDGVKDVVKREGIDFTLKVDPVSGVATISRILTGTIPDGGAVKVSYFYLEPFTVSTKYPAFVAVLANQLLSSKHAAADVLVKAMMPNPVDITMAVTLNSNTSPEAVDATIRTVINIALDNAEGTLHQSELIRQVQAITGVKSVQLPLIKCAKSDGSYDIGVVIPTGTSWTRLSADPKFAGLSTPQNSWITTSPVLPDSTIPSGGERTAIVDLLYEGQVFRRAMTVQDFLSRSVSVPRLASSDVPGSFYIIGTNDKIDTNASLPLSYAQKIMLVLPQDVPNPGNLSFLCTYQVFNEGGAKDITVSPTEYLAPGRITINYITG